jgi:WD40 repeat protein
VYNRDRILVWEVANRALKHNIASDVGSIFDLVFSNNGNYLAYAGDQGGAVLGGSAFQRLNFARFGDSDSVRFSPDDKVLAFAGVQRGLIRLWEIATNREVVVLKHPSANFVRFSKDGKTLVAAASSSRTVRIWNLAAREKLVVGAHLGGTPSVAFSPAGRRLASAGQDRTVRIWDPATGRLVGELTGFRAEVETVAFSPDGAILATGDWAGGIRFWQMPSGQELPAPMHPSGPQIWACAFSRDGRYFAACGQGGIVLWKVVASPADGRPDSRLVLEQVARPSGRVITSLGLSPDGNLLAWAPNEGSGLHLWDVNSSRPYPSPLLHVNGWVRNWAFYRDGKNLAFIRQGGMPEVWNLITRQHVHPFGRDDFRGARERGLDGIVALSSDDAWLAAAGARGSVTVWDMRQRELLLAMPEEHGSNWGLAWSPNRELLAASFSDGRLVPWNIPRIRAQLAEIGLDWQDSP